MGMRRDINCSTFFPVYKLEWYVGDRRYNREWNTQFITVSLSAADLHEGFNETKVTCKAVTMSGEIFEKSETIYVKGSYSNSVKLHHYVYLCQTP